MNEYLIGDTILRYQGEFPLAPDEFTDRFLLPGPGIEVKDTICYESAFFDLERRTGIEPASPAWKAGALPLSYRRMWPRVGGAGRSL